MFLKTMMWTFLATTSLARVAFCQTGGPSFDCAAASKPLERLICANYSLANADADMARRFRALRDISPPAERNRLISEQRQWIAGLQTTCSIPVSGAGVGPQGGLSCVAGVYKERILALNEGMTSTIRAQSGTPTSLPPSAALTIPVQPVPSPSAPPPPAPAKLAEAPMAFVPLDQARPIVPSVAPQAGTSRQM